MNKPIERLLWSIALPGFGQLLNREYIKGLTFIILEFLINVQANFNTAILLSFNGEIQAAFESINYLWLMFYPCLYFFAMWDAYKNAGGKHDSFEFLPFVSCAYFVTVGLMLSAKVKILGVNVGPIFTPMVFVIPGVLVGLISRRLILYVGSKSNNTT